MVKTCYKYGLDMLKVWPLDNTWSRYAQDNSRNNAQTHGWAIFLLVNIRQIFSVNFRQF